MISQIAGGTLIQCKNALLEAGAAKVSAFVTHAVFPQESYKRFIKYATLFSYVAFIPDLK